MVMTAFTHDFNFKKKIKLRNQTDGNVNPSDLENIQKIQRAQTQAAAH